MGRRRELVIVLCISLAFVALATWVGRGELVPPPLPEPSAPSERQRAPELALPELAGGTRSLAEFSGRVLVVNFWATWCGPCREELPALETLFRTLEPEGFTVLAVSVDAGSREAVRRFVSARGLSFPVLHDPESEAATRYGVRVYPTTAVIDRAGGLVTVLPSAWDWSAESSIAWFRSVLAEPTR